MQRCDILPASAISSYCSRVFQHCSYSPDAERRWILSDTYANAHNYRELYLYDTHDDRRIELGLFSSPPEGTNGLGCDLHPRWDRDGRQVCFDCVHEGSRQLYVMEVGRVTGCR